MTALADLIKETPFYKPLRALYHLLRGAADKVLESIFALAPKAGVERYQRMQERSYDRYTANYEDSKNLCVGNFEANERYSYEKYLLERYEGPREFALDFACGMGRMVNRMLAEFRHVDGVDLSANNLEYAIRYLTEKGHALACFDLYKSSGVGVQVSSGRKYDFIYSTIALQHIAVYDIRRQIFADLHGLLKPGGQCCFQMGFGWDNGVHWFDNRFAARTTNGGLDVCIPNDSHLPAIENDFLDLGFKSVTFTKKESPHPEIPRYHPTWLFIHLTTA